MKSLQGISDIVLQKNFHLYNKQVEETENFDCILDVQIRIAITSGRWFWLYIMLNQTITLMLTLLNVHIISF